MWLPRVSNHAKASKRCLTFGRAKLSKLTYEGLYSSNKSFSKCPPLYAITELFFFSHAYRNRSQYERFSTWWYAKENVARDENFDLHICKFNIKFLANINFEQIWPSLHITKDKIRLNLCTRVQESNGRKDTCAKTKANLLQRSTLLQICHRFKTWWKDNVCSRFCSRCKSDYLFCVCSNCKFIAKKNFANTTHVDNFLVQSKAQSRSIIPFSNFTLLQIQNSVYNYQYYARYWLI